MSALTGVGHAPQHHSFTPIAGRSPFATTTLRAAPLNYYLAQSFGDRQPVNGRPASDATNHTHTPRTTHHDR